MSVSKTSICNKALRKLGANPLMNVDTDNTTPATLCKASYDDVLQEVLRMHNWNFAVFRQSLVLDASGSPIYEFSNRFILPTIPIFIRLLSVENNIEYRLENNFLLTNESSVNIRFIGKETDPNKYDSLFIECFAARLAYEIGYSITSDETRIARTKQDLVESLSLARERDNLEDNDVAETSDSFSSSRITNFNFGNNINGITFS
jgi:hypothetical protein